MQTIKCPFCEAEIQSHVKKCKHCGEWIKKQDSILSSNDERVTCVSCGKKMIPRIITGPPLIFRGLTPVIKKTVCPFCGSTHQKFPPSFGEKVSLVIFIIFIVIFLFIIAPR